MRGIRNRRRATHGRTWRRTGPGRAELAELGCKQELNRGWSQFANFAISFSIISVLAGCFTVYGQAWNLGGPIAISIGWPVVAAIILTVAFSMAELASAFPRPAALLVGPPARRPGWSWFTGWFNVLGLIGIVASVDYVLAFFTSLFGLWGWDLGFVNFADDQHLLAEIFWVFTIILLLHAADQHLLLAPGRAVQQHLGVLARDQGGDHHRHPDLRPGPPPERDFVFTERINNSGFGMSMYWWFIPAASC